MRQRVPIDQHVADNRRAGLRRTQGVIPAHQACSGEVRGCEQSGVLHLERSGAIGGAAVVGPDGLKGDAPHCCLADFRNIAQRNDARVDTNQLWVGQLDGTSNSILIYNMLIGCNTAGIVMNEPSDTTSDVSGEEMSEVAKGKQRQVDTPELTGNPPTSALATTSVAPGKRKRVDNPKNPGVEPVQRVRTVHM